MTQGLLVLLLWLFNICMFWFKVLLSILGWEFAILIFQTDWPPFYPMLHFLDFQHVICFFNVKPGWYFFGESNTRAKAVLPLVQMMDSQLFLVKHLLLGIPSSWRVEWLKGLVLNPSIQRVAAIGPVVLLTIRWWCVQPWSKRCKGR